MSNPVPAPPQDVEIYFLQYNMLSGTEPIFAFVYNPTVLILPNTGGHDPTSYTVTFNLTSNIPGAVLISENTVSGGPPDLKVSGSGTTHLTLTFSNQEFGADDDFDYTLTVRANNTDYTSDDPEIEIPPPS